ncbi:MAG: putative signal transduction histidine kinase [Chitinophagaceae bacterium]|nr:putative signal transduction histidine kinase [Chitinophagaceae bacterium]
MPNYFLNRISKNTRLFVVLTFSCLKLASQNLLIHNYNVDEGLIQSQVNAFCQDADGYTWIGTYGGLSRFDGSAFTNFSTADGLPDNYISALTIDHEGALWCGTANGLSRYNGKKITNYFFSKDPAKNYVTGMALHPDGTIWCIASQHIYEIKNNKAVEFSPSPHIGNLNHIYVNYNGNVCITATQGTLYELRYGKWEPESINGISQNSLTIYNLYIEGDRTWFCTNKGLYYKEGNHPVLAYEQFGFNKIFSNTVTDIKKTRAGVYWIATENGVYTIDKKGLHHYTKSNGITLSKISTLFIDREDNTWIGSAGGEGFFLYTNAPFKNINEFNGLSSNNIRGIGKDASGTIWIATYGGGLHYIKKDKINTFPIVVDRHTSTNINTLLVKDNDIWIALDGKGLIKYNGTSLVHFLPSNSLLPSKYIFSLYADSQKRIWIGSGEGVAVYSDGQIKKPDHSNNAAFSFEEIGKDSLLIGNMFGLQLMHNYKLADIPSNHPVLKKAIVYCFLKAENKLWLGTDNNGILIWDIKTDSLQALTTKNGMSTNLVYSLVKGPDGLIYAGTGRGVHAISAGTDGYKIKVFNKSDGLPALECNRQAIFLNDDSTIWFGTSKGIFLFNPFRQEVPHVQLKPVMQSVELFSKPIVRSKYADSADQWNHVPWLLRLPYNQNNLSFYFKAISFANNERISYQYYIDGLEQTWSAPSTLNFASYNSLPPGSYVLKVRALLNGIPSGHILEYPFEIKAPFYATVYFKAAIIILLISLGFFIQFTRNIYQRRKLLQLENIRKEEQKSLKQRMAEDFHDEMGNKITRINLLTEVLKTKEATSQSTNIILDQIKDNAGELYTGTNDIIWSLNVESDNLFDTMERLLQFARQLFEDSSILFSYTGLAPGLEKIKLSSEQRRNIMMILKEALNNSLKHSGAHYVKLEIASEKNIIVMLTDDGTGFEITTTKKGHGIENMKRRAERINAGLVINSKKNGGTSIKLTLTL